MKEKNKKEEKLASVTAPLQRVQMESFELANAFQHLANAPVAEMETCDTDGIARIDLTAPASPSSSAAPVIDVRTAR
ncbi:MAG: hypothetical protein L0Y70_25445 [Gemmataceae bacterium]|nr:hypothetical protein [Gemmataceae bacterium]